MIQRRIAPIRLEILGQFQALLLGEAGANTYVMQSARIVIKAERFLPGQEGQGLSAGRYRYALWFPTSSFEFRISSFADGTLTSTNSFL